MAEISKSFSHRMTGAVSANLCNNVFGVYKDFENKNGVDWLRICQSPTCPKFMFKMHTIPNWPTGLLLGEDNIILQKWAHCYKVCNKNVENISALK